MTAEAGSPERHHPESHDVVIVGAGQAGGNLALALRRRGYAGSICLIGDEIHPPHERPPLSKDVLLGTATPDSTHLAPLAELADRATLRLGRRVVALDAAGRTVTLQDGSQIRGERIVLATGARARRLDLDGPVHYLRTIEDSLALGALLRTGGRLALVGGGTVGLEVASAALSRGMTVTVVEAADRLLSRLLPASLSDWLAERYRAVGARLLLGRSARAFDGKTLTLDDGSVVEVDAVVCGVGSIANDELARAAGLAVDNGVLVDEDGIASAPGIHAIGDLASRADPVTGRGRRLESWDNALQQSERLADRICGLEPAAAKPCWFWSDQLGHNIQVLGDVSTPASALLRGDPAGGGFCLLHHRDGRLLGAVAIDRGRDVRPLREILQRGLALPLDQLADPSVRLDKLLRQQPAVGAS